MKPLDKLFIRNGLIVLVIILILSLVLYTEQILFVIGGVMLFVLGLFVVSNMFLCIPLLLLLDVMSDLDPGIYKLIKPHSNILAGIWRTVFAISAFSILLFLYTFIAYCCVSHEISLSGYIDFYEHLL